MGNIKFTVQKIPFHKSDGDYNIMRGNGNAKNCFGAGWFGRKKKSCLTL
jgi:hypothetical protein